MAVSFFPRDRSRKVKKTEKKKLTIFSGPSARAKRASERVRSLRESEIGERKLARLRRLLYFCECLLLSKISPFQAP